MATSRVANSHAGTAGEVAAVGYVRVSTQDQSSADKTSLPLQREAITRYCKDHDLKLLKIYEDPGRSGATIERPGLQQLLADAKHRQFKKVIVFALSRWSRDLYQGLWLSKEIMVHGVEQVVSISEPLNGTDPLSNAMRSICQTFAAMEREILRDRLWSGRRKRFQQNRFAGGSIPFGMKLDRRTGKLVIEPKAAEVVRLIFKLRRQDKLTYTKLAAELNRRNIKAPSGGRWRPGTVHYTVNNKTYFGSLKYGETKSNAHDAIIPDGQQNQGGQHGNA